jgi:ATP-dependent Lhr-like helicase
VLDRFHPSIRSWFLERFETITAPQREGWPSILDGKDTLIAAPTGSGKTLAAFLSTLDDLVRRTLAGTLEDRIHAVYVSPLKALSNDVEKSLRVPLTDLARADPRLGAIRIAVRTGDTPARERAAMSKRPPHILVTTPESLYILLTAEKSRAALAGANTVIVDEIHAVAKDKRGAHLALTLERLDALVERSGRPRPQRIGLSATQRPIERVGELLVGDRPPPAIADAGFARELDLGIVVPSEELSAIATHEMMDEVYDRIEVLAKEHRTTLVFVNTRRLAERVARHLSDRLGAERVAAHHGSLSRETRLSAEVRLAAGELSVIVATASLELGIDVGDVELVVQIGSPRSIATFLQRVGRSGHCLRAIPKGRLFAMTRDQLVECAALVRSVKRRVLDQVTVRPAPLDVLAQQIVAEVAAEEWREAELFATFRRALPYRDLSREDFERVVEMLSDGVVAGGGRRTAYVHRDRVNGKLRGRRHARLVAMTSGGAIPDAGSYAVIADPEGTFVGTLDEDFALESMAGDIFQLGNTSWRILRVEGGRVRVEDARGLPPTIPFWNGEAPGRTRELSEEVSSLRADVVDAPIDRLADELALSRPGVEQLVHYLAVSKAMLGDVPTTEHVIAERFFDEGGGMQLVIHAPFGARINRAWGLALRKRFCRTFNFELQAAATDNGILISLGPVHSFPLISVFEYLRAAAAKTVLEQAILQAPVFAVRWRWVAQRSLAVPRFAGGKKVPAPILRMRTDDLLVGVFPMAAACQDNVVGPRELPAHPLVEEAMRDCLTEALDMEGLTEVLARIEDGRIRVSAVDLAEPSPLCHELVNANPYAYLDDAPLEERRARAVQTRRGLPPDVAEGLGAFDPAAIAEVDLDARPVARDPDELHDVLLSSILVAPSDAWAPFFDVLVLEGRATTASYAGRTAWVAVERVHMVEAAIEGAQIGTDTRFGAPPDRASAVTAIVRAALETSGPRTAAAIAETLGIDAPAVDAALHRLEAEGSVLRGRYSGPGPAEPGHPSSLAALAARVPLASGPGPAEPGHPSSLAALAARVPLASGPGPEEWCDRRILARIHRMTIGRLRREIEPVTQADLMRFLFRWQHVHPDTQLQGARGVLEILRQLEGVEATAVAWERDILGRRVHAYDPAWLDAATLGGEVVWGRLEERDGGDGAQVTRSAPIALVMRDGLEAQLAPRQEGPLALTPVARDIVAALADRGASFAKDLAKRTGHDARSIDDALRELVFAGMVTADGFGGLRGLLAHGPAGPGGRWSLLRDGVGARPDPDAVARRVLSRYGVVAKDLLGRESLPVPWREVLMVLRRLEARGEVRGGRFVAGFVGEQFALPEAVEALRSMRRSHPMEVVTIAATDPLNLVGIASPGAKVPAVGENAILFVDGVAVASREAGAVVIRGRLPEGSSVGPDLVLERRAMAEA